MKYSISKELFEAVEKQSYSDRHFKALLIPYDTFFFKCLDFVDTKGYIFNFDSRGYSRIKHISTGDFKLWEDKEFNKQRLFDACQWILDKAKQ